MPDNRTGEAAASRHRGVRLIAPLGLVFGFAAENESRRIADLRGSVATLPPPSWQAGLAVFPDTESQNDSSATAAAPSTSAPASDQDVEELEWDFAYVR